MLAQGDVNGLALESNRTDYWVGSTFGRLTEKPCLGRCLPQKTWSRSARCGPSFAACNTSYVRRMTAHGRKRTSVH